MRGGQGKCLGYKGAGRGEHSGRYRALVAQEEWRMRIERPREEKRGRLEDRHATKGDGVRQREEAAATCARCRGQHSPTYGDVQPGRAAPVGNRSAAAREGRR